MLLLSFHFHDDVIVVLQDESSEEEKVTASAPLQSVSAPHTVVGAGNELIQTQNQQSNKKARRRRKKKQSSDVSSILSIKDQI